MVNGRAFALGVITQADVPSDRGGVSIGDPLRTPAASTMYLEMVDDPRRDRLVHGGAAYRPAAWRLAAGVAGFAIPGVMSL
jgi:hypothetical protein